MMKLVYQISRGMLYLHYREDEAFSLELSGVSTLHFIRYLQISLVEGDGVSRDATAFVSTQWVVPIKLLRGSRFAPLRMAISRQ